MSWLFSQALVAEYSADTSLAGELSVPSNGIHMQQAFLSHGKTMGFSRLSRFGMTCRLLTDDRGAALLTSYLEDSHARTSAQLGGARELTAPDQACGSTWTASSVKYCRDSSSWKTAHCLWEEDLPWSSVTLPRWGMTRNGLVFQHPTRERPISANASGLLPTPLASNTKANHMRSGGRPSRSYWSTPSATDGQRGGTITENMTGTSLAQQINTPAKWPTPTVCGNYNRKGLSAASGDGLATAVKNWPTPTVNDSKNSTLPPSQIHHDNIPGALLRDGEKSGGQLNPTWVEWLMGWPLGWTDLKPLAMDKFREWQQQHSPFFTDDKAAA